MSANQRKGTVDVKARAIRKSKVRWPIGHQQNGRDFDPAILKSTEVLTPNSARLLHRHSSTHLLCDLALQFQRAGR